MKYSIIWLWGRTNNVSELSTPTWSLLQRDWRQWMIQAASIELRQCFECPMITITDHMNDWRGLPVINRIECRLSPMASNLVYRDLVFQNGERKAETSSQQANDYENRHGLKCDERWCSFSIGSFVLHHLLLVHPLHPMVHQRSYRRKRMALCLVGLSIVLDYPLGWRRIASI